MTDAYVETTVLTDLLLKPTTPKQLRAKAALNRHERTLLPVYSIKEWKAGPLRYFAYLHDKLVFTGSLQGTFRALSALPRSGYRRATAMEALDAAATVNKWKRTEHTCLGSTDSEMADSYRLALASLIVRSWRKRRKLAGQVVQELSCYVEAEPHIGKDGFFVMSPSECEPDKECSLADELKAAPKLLDALRNAIPEDSGRPEDQKRRKALKRLIKHPHEPLDPESCRHVGDAIFAFFCPRNAVILTTNLRDLGPLAESVGKRAEKP